jgi:hypothetical protein
MRTIDTETYGRFSRWVLVAQVLAVGAVAWAFVVPDGPFWTGAMAAGMVGLGVATVLVMRNRAVPSLAQVIDAAERER